MPLCRVPFVVGMRPVRIATRLGMQIGLATKKLPKAGPRDANVSMAGLRTIGLP